MANLAYLKYVFKHKWYVIAISFKLNLPLFQALFHDISKFSYKEFVLYRDTFYNKDGSKKPYFETKEFNEAWLKHIHKNPHHWEYWIIPNATSLEVLDMPKKYIVEMLADWYSAGLCISGEKNPVKYYLANKENIIISQNTREFLESLMRKVGWL